MHLNTACLLQYAHVHFALVKPTSDYYYYYLLLLIGIHWKCSFFELYYVVLFTPFPACSRSWIVRSLNRFMCIVVDLVAFSNLSCDFSLFLCSKW